MSSARQSSNSYQPIIVVGSAYCGGNVLRDALCALPGFASWSFDDTNPLWLRGLARRGHDELETGDVTDHVRRSVRRAFEQRAAATGAQFLVELTPANSLRVPFVQSVLPDARFLFLVRDGRDVLLDAQTQTRAGKQPLVGPKTITERLTRVATSPIRALSSRVLGIAEPPYGPHFRGIVEYQRRYGRLQTLAKQWAASVSRAAEAFEELTDNAANDEAAGDLVLPMQYEALIADPIDELWDVCDFLDVDPGDEAIESAAAGLAQATASRWEDEVSPEQLQPIAATLDPVLAEFGYRRCPRVSSEDELRAAA